MATPEKDEETAVADASPRRSATPAKPPINNGSSEGNDDVKKKKKTKSKKERGAFGIFKAALFMLRKKNSTGDKKPVAGKDDAPTAANNPNWTKLVDSMRPLHHQETPGSPPVVVRRAEEIVLAPPSPAASTSTGGTMSRYASAQSLRDLCMGSDDEDEEDDEEEDPDAMFDALCEDEMIDTKADEFIARFYRQIKLQNSTAAHHQ